jgi:predicted aldo/keto reductase-like oxidoreductase
MKYRALGKAGLKVSVIGFGGIKLPNISFEEAVEVVRRALDLGVNFIDTARHYRDSERRIGEAIKGRRDECYIATKTAERDYSGALKDIKTSLKELNVDYIDLAQLHTVSDRDTYNLVMKPNGALEALKYAKKRGLVEHIGVSCHRDLNVMKDLIESGEFETIMVAYSPIDQENVAGIIDLAAEKAMGVIAMKPLCGGDLTLPPNLKKDRPDQLVIGSLKWVLSNKKVSTVIPGMQSIREVEENVSVGDMKLELSNEEKAEIINLIGRLIGEFGKSFRYGQRCLRCHYCQPCPQGIIIPVVFRALDMYMAYPDDLKYMGVELYRSLKVKPDACLECESCVKKCPAKLPIPEMLKEALKVFSNCT